MEWEVPSPCAPGFQEDRERGFLTGRVRHTHLCTCPSTPTSLEQRLLPEASWVREGFWGQGPRQAELHPVTPSLGLPTVESFSGGFACCLRRKATGRAPLSLNPDANRVCSHPLPGFSVALQDRWLTSLRWLLTYNELILSQRKAPCPVLATEEKRRWGRHSANTSRYKATAAFLLCRLRSSGPRMPGQNTIAFPADSCHHVASVARTLKSEDNDTLETRWCPTEPLPKEATSRQTEAPRKEATTARSLPHILSR